MTTPAYGSARSLRRRRCATRRAHMPIASVMTFGGEPLLYPETVFAIHEAARAAGVPKPQIITNGFFCAKQAQREETARRLAQCGVNDVLLSVDAFHQETIPLGAGSGIRGGAARAGRAAAYASRVACRTRA